MTASPRALPVVQVTGTSEYRDGKRLDYVGTCKRATPEPRLDVVDVSAADDTAAVLFQRMLAER